MKLKSRTEEMLSFLEGYVFHREMKLQPNKGGQLIKGTICDWR